MAVMRSLGWADVCCPWRFWLLFVSGSAWLGLASSVSAFPPATAERPVRSLAVVDFGFEEANGSAQDGARVGGSADAGELKAGARRVASPFWGQDGKRAILLGAGRKQFVQIPEGADVDRPQAVSLSLFFLNLHPLNDNAFHGLVAKRAEAGGGGKTNYGINYRPANDAFQLYINDGGGFRTVVYSVKEVIGSRKLVHLTAVWEVGDAPGSDADTDPDDVRVRLFVNGESVAPQAARNGQVVEHDGWMQNINIANLLNDVPVTLGSSTPTTEHASGLIDEFLLFDRALTPNQAAKLFEEVAGPHGKELARQEAAPVAAADPKPAITMTSLHGLKAGQSTRLTVTGSNLGPNARLVLPGVSFEQKRLETSNADRLDVEVTLPEACPLGWFPLYLASDSGISSPLTVAIDTLDQKPAAGSSPKNPARLPAAFSGRLAGSQIAKIYFQGKAGDLVTAEVEARRLGSALDPVVEIKTERGTPLFIAWGETVLRGDARAECRLPHDGLYFVELHDLAYKARGQNRFRLKVGDFASIDQWFPAKAAAAEKFPLKPIGHGLPADSALEFSGNNSPGETVMPQFLAGWKNLGPTPPLEISQAVEVIEKSPGEGFQTVDATFQTKSHLPVAINGIVSKPEELDRYVLQVRPGRKLRFRVRARSLSSPLDALLTVRNHPAGNILVYKEDSGTARDPEAEFTVPENIREIQVGVEDLHERGGEGFVYRLNVAPADAPDFELKIPSPQVTLPADGSAVVEISLTRRNYTGPIRLRVEGDKSITLVPEQIPAGQGNRNLFVSLVRTTNGGELGFRGLTIIGESVGLDPELVRTAEIDGGRSVPPGFSSLLPVAIEDSAAVHIETASLPEALFKGVPATVPVKVRRQGETTSAPVVRLSLLTTEPDRRNDPRDPKKGNKPKIRSAPGQAVGRNDAAGPLRIAVPSDIAVTEIDAVIKAELVPHAYSDKVAGIAYSRPFKLPIKTAAAVKLDENSLKFIGGTESHLKGAIERTPPFNGPVTLRLTGLPDGYETREVTVPPGQTAFELPLKPAPTNAVRTVKAKLSATFRGRSNIRPDQSVELKIEPEN